MDNAKWEFVAKVFEDKFGIPRNILELVASRDILQLVASGSSNETIARFLDMDTKYINKLVFEHCHFGGWDADLDINPYQIYTNLCNNGYSGWSMFYKEISLTTPYYSEVDIMRMYTICEYFMKIETSIEEVWK